MKYLDYAGDLHYPSIISSLLFAAQSRPDIQHAISLVSQFGSNPGISYLEAAKWILCYLKGTIEYSLMLGHHGIVWSSWVNRLKLGLGSRWFLISRRFYFWDYWEYSDLVIKEAVYSGYIFSWSRVYGISKCHKGGHLVENAVEGDRFPSDFCNNYLCW